MTARMSPEQGFALETGPSGAGGASRPQVLPLEPHARAEAIYRLILQSDDPDPDLWAEYTQAVTHIAFLDPSPVRELLERIQQEVPAVDRQAEALAAVTSKVGWTEALREQDYSLAVRWDRLMTQGETCMVAMTRALKREAARIPSPTHPQLVEL